MQGNKREKYYRRWQCRRNKFIQCYGRKTFSHTRPDAIGIGWCARTPAGGTDSFDINNNRDRSDLNISPRLVESYLYCNEEASTLSDGDDQVGDNEIMKTVKQKLNIQSLTLPQNKVKIHKVMLDMPMRIGLIHCLFDQNKNV